MRGAKGGCTKRADCEGWTGFLRALIVKKRSSPLDSLLRSHVQPVNQKLSHGSSRQGRNQVYSHTHATFLLGVAFLRKPCSAEVTEIFLRNSIDSSASDSALSSNDRCTGLVMFDLRDLYSHYEGTIIRIIGNNMLGRYFGFECSEKNKSSILAPVNGSFCRYYELAVTRRR
jgi:hypothetical protein